MPARKLVFLVLLTLLGGAACAPPRGPSPKPATALNCYLVQLHLHGHSNHNGNSLPASMESHSAEARRYGFDVIWWSDHAELYGTYRDLKLDFTAAILDSSGDRVIMGARLGRQLSAIQVQKTEGSRARLDKDRLVLVAEAAPAMEGFRTIRITPVSRIGKVHTINFCRPVTSGLKIDTWLDAQGFARDTYLKFGFDLSWHPGGQHHAVFTGSDGAAPAPLVVGDTTVVAQFEVPGSSSGGSTKISFDLEKIARLLPRGDDNTLSSFYMEIGARSGGAISVGIDSIIIRSDRPGGSNQYGVVDSLARAYSEDYGLREYVGVEVGKIDIPGLPHMNAYYPGGSTGYRNLDLDTKMKRQDWVASVHRKGGLVSFNHPFGANRTPRGGNVQATDQSGAERGDYEDLPPATAPRVLARQGPAAGEEAFWEVAEPLLEGRGLDADMLEVGYLFRGIGSLDDHLRLWDLALAHGIRLVGTGTSDSHGGVWGPDMVPNPFASWVWAQSSDAGDLLTAIRQGRVAFGDPFLWKSKLLLHAEGDAGKAAIMGDTLHVSARHSARGWVEIKPMREDVEVRVIQVTMKKARELEKTVTSESAAGAASGFPIVAGDSCYVRVEVYALDGTPLAFTNPIFFFPKK